jgi:hypothetical protein
MLIFDSEAIFICIGMHLDHINRIMVRYLIHVEEIEC